MLAGSLSPALLSPIRSNLYCSLQQQVNLEQFARLQASPCVSQNFHRHHQSYKPALKAPVGCPRSARLDMGSSSEAEDVAIVLVDHGSRRAEANAMLEDFADLYRCIACHL